VRQRHYATVTSVQRKRVTLLPPLAEQIAGELGNLPGHGVEFEAAKKPLRLGLLARAHAYVNVPIIQDIISSGLYCTSEIT